jgi:hypothetical protein
MIAAPRVFVSHRHADEAFTTHLVSDLAAAGADVWVDIQGINDGDFLGRINEALSNREWLVLVMSPDALTSKWVTQEVNAALARWQQGFMRGVVPIMARHCNPREIPPLWTTLHRYDATQDYGDALQGLLRTLGLGSQVRTASEPATNEAPAPTYPSEPHSSSIRGAPCDQIGRSRVGPDINFAWAVNKCVGQALNSWGSTPKQSTTSHADSV